MSLREQINQVREEKLKLPFKKDTFRMMGSFKNRDFKVVIKYSHERRDPKYIEHSASNLKDAVTFLVKAEDELPAEEEK